MNRIRAYIRIGSCGIVLVLYFVKLQFWLLLKGQDTEVGFRIRRQFTSRAVRILGLDLIVSGSPVSRTCLYVSNHRCMTDPLVQLSRINALIVSKAEVENYPIIGKGSVQTGIIFVKREEKSSRLATREAIRDALRENKSVLIYPEGTTSTLSGMLEFKSGSFEVAEELGIPVVPVVIEYGIPEDYWGEATLMSHFLKKFSKPITKAYLWIGEPIEGKTSVESLKTSRDLMEEKIRQIHNFEATW